MSTKPSLNGERSQFMLAGIAFALTVLMFSWVRVDPTMDRQFSVGVRWVTPPDSQIVSPQVDRVQVGVRGRLTAVQSLDPTEIDPIVVTLGERRNQQISIGPNDVTLPTGIKVTTIFPRAIDIELEAIATKSVPIQVRIIGHEQDSYAVGTVATNVDSVEVRGPASRVEPIDAVWTAPIDVTGLSATFRRTVAVRISDPLVTLDRNEVSVTVPIETPEVTRTLQNIKVLTLNSRYDSSVRPESMSVTIRGPKVVVDQLNEQVLHATIDLAAENDRPPSTFQRQPKVMNLPREVKLVQFHPTDFLVTTSKRKPALDE